jgi:hypothetical protein
MIVAVWEDKKDNATFSEKVDAHFSGLENLYSRLQAVLLILRTRTFPACSQVGPSSVDEILKYDTEHSRFTLMDDYNGHGAGILVVYTDSMLKL